MPRFKAALVVLVALSSVLVGCTILDRLSQDSDPIVEDASIDAPSTEGADGSSADTGMGNDAASQDGAASADGDASGAEDANRSDAADADASAQDAQTDGDAG